MDTRTGEIRELQEGEKAKAHEVALMEAEAAEALTMPPLLRLPWWAARVAGKDRKKAHLKVGPDLTPAHRRAVLAAGDHQKAHVRKIAKAARRAARPHVKRQSRAHSTPGRARK
jgi:hypothetical protein